MQNENKAPGPRIERERLFLPRGWLPHRHRCRKQMAMSYLVQVEPGTTGEPARKEPSELRALFASCDRWALFLDVDGTLLDLAATPDGVVLPPGLADDLDALAGKLGGALALVTGRSIAFVDALFSPRRFPVAGLHGSERRSSDGTRHESPLTGRFLRLKQAISARAGAWDGVLVEDKHAAIAVHYRLAPDRQADVEALMLGAAAEAGPGWTLQRGKMVAEIRPSQADKGAAVNAFLEDGPFRGRAPFVIGDDVTDEAMFDVANARGGLSVRVGPPPGPTAARLSLATPGDVRAFLALAALYSA
ncbi:trehalose-phosphatase [Ensifer soli]|uniref:trehalose-phosphatase n=1 Tax=Ciceribacter sp. sgz301302 TaxID=3342379 RepID=UPI0035B7F826